VKAASAGLITHIAQGVTTLATLFRVVRRDGAILGFTDHDRDLTFESLVYEASTGYMRSAISNQSDLSVDNLELTALLDSPRITKADLRAGLYDDASFEMRMVNWQNLADGAIKLRAGNLGRSVVRDGTFTLELRGLGGRFERVIGDVYSPRCRADVFDTANAVIMKRCGLSDLAIDPNTTLTYRRDNRVHSVVTSRRQFQIKGAVAPGATVTFTLTNPGAESGSTAGWTVASGEWAAVGTVLGIAPHGGVFQFRADATLPVAVLSVLEQSVDLVAGGLAAATIDTGLQDLSLRVWVANGAGAGAQTAEIGLRVLDANNVVLQDERTLVTPNPGATYTEFLHQRPLPVGARFAVIRLLHNNPTLVAGEFLYDDVTLEAQDEGHVALPSIAAYFTGGLLQWVSGANKGRAMEVKLFSSGVGPGGELKLFLPMPFLPVENDRFLIWPGCDKTLAVCTAKFANAVNFRGEPHLPGRDRLLKYPDAQA
jgi:hypothetical protein